MSTTFQNLAFKYNNKKKNWREVEKIQIAVIKRKKNDVNKTMATSCHLKSYQTKKNDFPPLPDYCN